MLSDKISSLPDHTCPSHKSSVDVYARTRNIRTPFLQREQISTFMFFTVLLVVFLMALDPKDYSFIESGEV